MRLAFGNLSPRLRHAARFPARHHVRLRIQICADPLTQQRLLVQHEDSYFWRFRTNTVRVAKERKRPTFNLRGSPPDLRVSLHHCLSVVRFCKTQVGLRSLPRSPYAGLGVRLWLLLVIIFFGFFEVKFRKKLKSDSNGCQGSLYQGDMKPSKHSGQRPYHPTCVTSVQMR